MPIELPALPYDANALEPHFTTDAVEHHRRRQQLAVDALNGLLAGSALAEAPLEEIVRKARGALAEHAAQCWNIDFFWAGLKPAQAEVGAAPAGKLAQAIDARFGNIAALRQDFIDATAAFPGEGWIWLVQRRSGRLDLVSTPGSGSPLTGEDTPLLACSLWEHAYAIDYRDARERYFDAFWKLVDWSAVARRMR